MFLLVSFVFDEVYMFMVVSCVCVANVLQVCRYVLSFTCCP